MIQGLRRQIGISDVVRVGHGPEIGAEDVGIDAPDRQDRVRLDQGAGRLGTGKEVQGIGNARSRTRKRSMNANAGGKDCPI